MIVYKINVISELKKNGYSTYRIRKEQIFAQSQLAKLRNHQQISFEVLDRVCALTHLQPGDILEYVPDDDGAPE